LVAAARGCLGCELYERADQTVSDAGSVGAAVMLSVSNREMSRI